MSNESKFENEYKNYKVDFIQLLDELDEGRWAHEPDMRAELDEVYAQATKADEYEANLNEVKRQLKIKIRHARRDGDYSEAGAFSEALDMIENSI